MPADFSGTWKLILNENLDAYLQALDIDFPTRKIATLLKPEKVIEQNGNSFVIKTNSTFRNYEVQFTVGEEFDEDVKCLDNRKCKELYCENQVCRQVYKKISST
ncbi:retinoid-binding protein 7 [Mobula birostris]|uniref:retinoid-binding protein 7 n=1 Tax=Mobula birostris TaxID=1983395 RepID=UPI003B28AADA